MGARRLSCVLVVVGEDAAVFGFGRRSAAGESVALRLLNLINLTTAVVNARHGIVRFLLWLFLWPFMLILLVLRWAIRHPLLTGMIVIPGLLWWQGHTGPAVAVLATTTLVTPVIRLSWPELQKRWGRDDTT